jgi:hypothetical protein
MQLGPLPDYVAEDLWISRGLVPNRRVAEDGKKYTLEEYRDYYGYFAGCQKWNEAPPYLTLRVAEDGKDYTLLEFRAFYGHALGNRMWNEAPINRTTMAQPALTCGTTDHLDDKSFGRQILRVAQRWYDRHTLHDRSVGQ